MGNTPEPGTSASTERQAQYALPLIERVERRIDLLARRMVTTFVAEIPIYGWLPQEQLDGEIRGICRENLRIFFRCVREHRRPDEAELGEPRASAARRAEERVPLDAVVTAYHLGGRIGWQAIAEEANDAEHAELTEIADRVMAYIQDVTSAVASAYLEEQQHIYGEERDARRTLSEALISGSVVVPSDGVARRGGVQLSSGYLLLALRLGPSADERDAGVMGAIAGRRKVRRVQAMLDALAGEAVLSLLDADGGAVLFPVPPDEADQAVATADELVAALAAAAEADVWAGCAWREGVAGVAEAAAESREVLRLAELLGRTPGVFRLDDVLLEHTLTQPPEVAGRLARLLAPLDAKPDLVQTLDAWYGADFDRRHAAAALNIHPNTLDYRLRRVGEMTGLDVTTAHGLQLIGAALMARHLGRP